MSKFRVLLLFAMSKRLGNKIFIGWNVVLFVIVMAMMFSDVLLKQWSPSVFEKQIVYVYEMPEFVEMIREQETSMEFIMFDDWSEMENLLAQDVWIIHKTDHYQVLSNQDFSPLPWISLNQVISVYEDWKLKSSLSEEEYLARQMPQVIPVNASKEKESSHNQTWAFLMITSIYFVALSYVGIAASDVVHEKSTRMMELILTCVSSTTHLIAKLLSGWLVLLIQVGFIVVDVLISFIFRYGYDKGTGLLDLLKHLNLMEQGSTFDFGGLLSAVLQNPMILGKVLVGFGFMLIGILFVQTILVILSSFIGSIEESGTIQSPFYLLFMAVYYLTIFLNTPTHMNEGVGKHLSMFPFFSMLFMPCRMFYYEVSAWEIGLSFMIAVGSLIALWIVGAPIYQIGVLDYSSKPITSKLATSFRVFVSQPFFQRS